MSELRDIDPAPDAAPDAAPVPAVTGGRSGRNVIAVIGIDRYQNEGWQPLSNSVSDARGAAELFGKLGFEQVAALYNDGATREAIEGLVTDDLRQLGEDDNLVLFYAGHGSTQSHRFEHEEVKTGYLIPFDAVDRTATWIELNGWLRAVSLLPAKHILVILDACHSGIALGPIIRWRGGGARELPLSALRARRSRRIITSTLDNELALDSGPVLGHSLFTGCLIEALTYGVGRADSRVVTSTELALYLRDRVEKYPRSRQTPDFGAFDLDERGEMVLPFLMAAAVPEAAAVPAVPEAPKRDRPDDERPPDAAPLADRAPDRRWRRMALAGIAGGLLVLPPALITYRAFSKEAAPPAESVDTVALATAGPSPVDVSALRGELLVLQDTAGGMYVVGPKSAAEPRVFYGTGEVLYEQRVHTFSKQGDWWSLDVSAPSLPDDQTSTLWHKADGTYGLRCTGEEILAQVTGDRARAILERHRFMSPKLVYRPYLLGRDEHGVYYYVDQLADPRGGRDPFRLLVGRAGALKELALVGASTDGAGSVFAARGGQLASERAGAGGRKLTWIQGAKRTALVWLDLDQYANLNLIYRELGVYELSGTMCADSRSPTR